MTDKHKTRITKKIHKGSITLERSKIKLLEGLNMFDGTLFVCFPHGSAWVEPVLSKDNLTVLTSPLLLMRIKTNRCLVSVNDP